MKFLLISFSNQSNVLGLLSPFLTGPNHLNHFSVVFSSIRAPPISLVFVLACCILTFSFSTFSFILKPNIHYQEYSQTYSSTVKLSFELDRYFAIMSNTVVFLHFNNSACVLRLVSSLISVFVILILDI